MKLNNITIGTDLEVFLRRNKSILSSIGIIGGTKKDPLPIGNMCFVQEDNILAEANIPPVTDKASFIGYINYIKDHITTTHEVDLHYSSSENVDFMVLSSPGAKEFGCEKSLIVDLHDDSDEVTDEVHHHFVADNYDSTIRTSGFHIHIGYDNPDEKVNREIVKLFEKNVTLPLLGLDIDEHNRRQMYGKSGEYRHKEYGVECRSLGGALLRDDFTIGKVWDGIETTIEQFNQGERVNKEEFEIIKDIINTN